MAISMNAFASDGTVHKFWNVDFNWSVDEIQSYFLEQKNLYMYIIKDKHGEYIKFLDDEAIKICGYDAELIYYHTFQSIQDTKSFSIEYDFSNESAGNACLYITNIFRTLVAKYGEPSYGYAYENVNGNEVRYKLQSLKDVTACIDQFAGNNGYFAADAEMLYIEIFIDNISITIDNMASKVHMLVYFNDSICEYKPFKKQPDTITKTGYIDTGF